MLAPNVFQFLPGGGAVRRYRKRLQLRIQQEPAIRLLPTLLNLPLFAAGALPDGASSLLEPGVSLALHGAEGSGRSLALLQSAWQWAGHGRGDPPLLLPLAQIDAPNLTPRAVLVGAFHAAGLPAPFERPAPAANPRVWLLIDDWEALPPPRREAWRAFVLALPRVWPEARVVISLPDDDFAWAELRSVALPDPASEQIRRWLAHLLPGHDCTPLLAALELSGGLATLSRRLIDLALFAMTYPAEGLPQSRRHLYERASFLVEAVVSADDGHSDQAAFCVGHGPLRHYRLACAYAAGAGPALADLEEHTRRQVALLLADLLPDPAPLFAELWGPDEPTPADQLILGHCLCERPDAAPAWGLRIVATLAQQVNSRPHQALLRELGSHLPVLLAAANTASDDQGAALLAELGPTLGAAALVRLLDTPGIRPPWRWSAAAALRRLPSDAAQAALAANPPPDRLAQAARCFVLTLGNAATRQALAAADGPAWANALLDPQVAPQQRLEVATALLADPALPAAMRTAALALLPPDDDQRSGELLAQACAAAEPIRQAALTALAQWEPRRAIAVLGAALLAPATPWEACWSLLDALAGYRQAEASLLLARCVLNANLPLAGRLRALELLAVRPNGGSLLLRRLLPRTGDCPPLRAGLLWLMGTLEQAAECIEVRRIALAAGPLLVRQAAIAALGRTGRQSAVRQEALKGLLALLNQTQDDALLLIAAIQALGQIAAIQSLPALSALMGAAAVARVRAGWLVYNPALAHLPAEQWAGLDLPPDARVRLLTALTRGATNADQPSSFDELVNLEAAQVRMAAVEAIAAIGAAAPIARSKARAILHAALPGVAPGPELRHLLACLARLSSDGGLSELEHLLADRGGDPARRWLAIEQLGASATAIPRLVHHLEQGDTDPFTAGKLAAALGMHRAALAVPALRHLAEHAATSSHLRAEAIAALGQIDDPAARFALLHLVTDGQAPPHLRSAAARALSAPAAAETSHLLRETLLRERQRPELLAGILEALGRAHDRDALPLLLRYAQHEHPAVALAALAALAEIGDAAVAPTLVHMAQNTLIEPIVRLHAVGALLRLEGAQHLPLLRRYLDNGGVSLQLQACEYLLNQQPADPYPQTLLADQAAPLALRLRATDALAERVDDHPALAALLHDQRDNLMLRSRAALLLGQSGQPAALEALVACAGAAATPPRLRRSCLAALTGLAHADGAGAAAARLALSRIADDPTQPDEGRTWATCGLIAGATGIDPWQFAP